MSKDKINDIVEKLGSLGVNERKALRANTPLFVAKVVNPRSGKTIYRVELKPADSFKPIAIVRAIEDLELLEEAIKEIRKSYVDLVLAIEKLNSSGSKKTKHDEYFEL